MNTQWEKMVEHREGGGGEGVARTASRMFPRCYRSNVAYDQCDTNLGLDSRTHLKCRNLRCAFIGKFFLSDERHFTSIKGKKKLLYGTIQCKSTPELIVILV